GDETTDGTRSHLRFLSRVFCREETPADDPRQFQHRIGNSFNDTQDYPGAPGLPNRSGSATPRPPQDSGTATISGELSREGSTTSLNRIGTAPVAAAASTPSPILELPEREAAALATELAAVTPEGPSPLTTTAPESISADEQPTQTAPAVVINEAESP
ncbi:hypothetical protein PAXINDRAFT_102327, partial [Paxillus involutus ATCC 200175]